MDIETMMNGRRVDLPLYEEGLNLFQKFELYNQTLQQLKIEDLEKWKNKNQNQNWVQTKDLSQFPPSDVINRSEQGITDMVKLISLKTAQYSNR